MGRKKIEIRPLTDERNRNVTFLKRKAGLMKKAWELSVLCSADVSIVIFSAAGKAYEFSSKELDVELDRYLDYEGLIERRRAPEFAAMALAGEDGSDDEDEPTTSRRGSTSKAAPTKSLKGRESFKARMPSMADLARMPRNDETRGKSRSKGKNRGRNERKSERKRSYVESSSEEDEDSEESDEEDSEDAGVKGDKRRRHEVDDRHRRREDRGVQDSRRGSMTGQAQGPSHGSQRPGQNSNRANSQPVWESYYPPPPSTYLPSTTNNPPMIPRLPPNQATFRVQHPSQINYVPIRSQPSPAYGVSQPPSSQSSYPPSSTGHHYPLDIASTQSSHTPPPGPQSAPLPNLIPENMQWDPQLIARYAEYQLQQNHQRQQRALLEQQRQQLMQIGVPLDDKSVLDQIFGNTAAGSGGHESQSNVDHGRTGAESNLRGQMTNDHLSGSMMMSASAPPTTTGSHVDLGAQERPFEWPNLNRARTEEEVPEATEDFYSQLSALVDSNKGSNQREHRRGDGAGIGVGLRQGMNLAADTRGVRGKEDTWTEENPPFPSPASAGDMRMTSEIESMRGEGT